MHMNLEELYRLRTYAHTNTNKVIAKDAFLNVIDSHIEALYTLDICLQARALKMPPRGLQGLEGDIIRQPVTRSDVLEKYKQGI